MVPVPVTDQVKFAGGLLEGNPALWWLAVHKVIKTLSVGDQWNSFKNQIKAYFQLINTAIDAHTCLDQIHQRTSILVYNTEFHEIILQLPNMDEAD